MTESIRTAASDLKRQLVEKVEVLKKLPEMADIKQLHQALNALEGVLGEPKTSLLEAFGFDEVGAPAQTTNPIVSVRFDEFYGVPALQAAKRYLKKCADARPFAEIVDAIVRGGGKVASEEELRMGLIRSTLEVVKIQDRYGAIEKYPDVKRGGGKKRLNATSESASAEDAASRRVSIRPSNAVPDSEAESPEVSDDEGSDQ